MKKVRTRQYWMKMVFRSVAALAMLLVLVLCPMQAKASSEELTPEILGQKLEALQIQFPDGRYWNHDLDVDNNPEGTTDHPCKVYGHGAGKSSYCNYVEVNGLTASQCWGFSALLSQKLYGTYFGNWNKTKNMEAVKPGDVLQYGYSASKVGHTVMVLGVSVDDVYVVDCNSYANCVIRWFGIESKKNINALMNAGGYENYNTNGIYCAPMALPLEDGHCGMEATYVLEEDGTLTISGTGSLYDCFFENEESVKKVIIRDGITGIGLRTFANCVNLQSVQLPDGLRTIYAKSFLGCTALSEVNVPKRLKELGANAFQNCALTVFDLPQDILTVGKNVFYGCPGFAGNRSHYRIQDGIMTISGKGEIYQGLFKNHTDFRKVIIEDGIQVIENSAFEGCSSLKVVSFPDSLLEVGYLAFSKCALVNVELPDNLEKEGENIFLECPGYCGNHSRYVLENRVLRISGTGEIYEGAFFYKDTFNEVYVEEGITGIGPSAFGKNDGMTYLELPQSLRSIGRNAFLYCTSLRKVDCYAPALLLDWAEPTRDNFVVKPEKGTIFSVAADQLEYYEAKFGDVQNVTFSGDLPGGEEAVSIVRSGQCGQGVWYDLMSDGTLIIEGVGVMDHQAFDVRVDPTWNCIRNVIVKAAVKDLGWESFYGCKALQTIKIPYTVGYFPSNVIAECTALTDVYCYADPEYFTNGDGFATDGLKVHVMAKDLETWQNHENVPAEVVFIGDLEPLDEAFDFRKGRCGTYAYYELDEENTLRITGSGVLADNFFAYTWSGNWSKDNICQYAFNFRDVQKVIIGEGITGLGEKQFKGLSALTEVILPETLETMGRETFYDCHQLTYVTIPHGMTKIGQSSFLGCDKVMEFSCLANPDVLTWDKPQTVFGSMQYDFRTEGTMTICHVPSNYLKRYQEKFPYVYVTFVGDLAPDLRGVTLEKTEAKEATCTEDGNIAYYWGSDGRLYANAEGILREDQNGDGVLDLLDVIVPATGHVHTKESLSWRWEKAGEDFAVTACMKCMNCGAFEESVPAEVVKTEGESGVTYVATATVGNTEVSMTREIKNEYYVTIDGEPSAHPFGDRVRVYAAQPSEGMAFAGWYEGDTLVCNSTELDFLVSRNISLHTVYVNAEEYVEPTEPILNFNLSERVFDEKGNQKLDMTVTWSLMDGMTVKDVGLVRTTDAAAELSLGNEDVKKRSAGIDAGNGTYIHHLTLGSVSSALTAYAKAYLVYDDAQGEEHVLYTELATSKPIILTESTGEGADEAGDGADADEAGDGAGADEAGDGVGSEEAGNDMTAEGAEAGEGEDASASSSGEE